MPVNSVSIGKKIKKIRLENDLTQVEFAKIFNLNQQNLSRYENGNFQIPYTDLANIARHFRISMDYFFEVDIEEITEDERFLLAYYRGIHEKLKSRTLNVVKTLAEEFPNDTKS